MISAIRDIVGIAGTGRVRYSAASRPTLGGADRAFRPCSNREIRLAYAKIIRRLPGRARTDYSDVIPARPG